MCLAIIPSYNDGNQTFVYIMITRIGKMWLILQKYLDQKLALNAFFRKVCY